MQQMDGDQPLLAVEVQHQRTRHQRERLGDGGQQQVGVGAQLHLTIAPCRTPPGRSALPRDLGAGDGEVDQEVPGEPRQGQRPHPRGRPPPAAAAAAA